MEADEILRRAWEAVQKSGVPETLHEVAFREAIETLRAEHEGGSHKQAKQGGGENGDTQQQALRNESHAGTNQAAPTVDEATFFSQLSHESGIPETELRDVLSLARDEVHVNQPARKLGANTAERARTIIALVAGARAFGLNERPVKADPVRQELRRKNAYDSANFSAKHLGPLEGFNAGADRTEIRPTSKWDRDFSTAIDHALGRTKGQDNT